MPGFFTVWFEAVNVTPYISSVVSFGLWNLSHKLDYILALRDIARPLSAWGFVEVESRLSRSAPLE